MKLKAFLITGTLFLHTIPCIVAQDDIIDTTVINKIKQKALHESQVMDILSQLTEMIGPRLTYSPSFKTAAAYTKNALESYGLSNVHFETWGKPTRGWQLKRFSLQMTEPYSLPLMAYPNAYSPSVKGVTNAEVVLLDAHNKKDLEKYRGKLKDKIILMDDIAVFQNLPDGRFSPDATRFADSTLLKMANDLPFQTNLEYSFDTLTIAKYQLCQTEKPLAMVSGGYLGRDGNIALVDLIYIKNDNIVFSGEEEIPDPVPQICISREQWNQLKRKLENNIKVKLELVLETEFSKPEDGFNVIGEIPGTDLKNEIVMIGGHLDSWHAATGATDDAAGVAVCMEAMRIIKSLALQPRRTIRIGLWGGEEQGLLGSKGYVLTHLAERSDKTNDDNVNLDSVKFKEEYNDFSVYFNMDNGAGRFRGIYMEENEKVRPIFKQWFSFFADMGASTLTSQRKYGTDHNSFYPYLIPAFQFIQDPIDYQLRTHHTTMDIYDKVLPDDMKQNVAIMASFAWMAAIRDEKFPRRDK
jgi:carboxypeptidase Q